MSFKQDAIKCQQSGIDNYKLVEEFPTIYNLAKETFSKLDKCDDEGEELEVIFLALLHAVNIMRYDK